MERLALYPLRCWMVIAGIYLLCEAGRCATGGGQSSLIRH